MEDRAFVWRSCVLGFKVITDSRTEEPVTALNGVLGVQTTLTHQGSLLWSRFLSKRFRVVSVLPSVEPRVVAGRTRMLINADFRSHGLPKET
jgi:hypothetical protein